MNPDQIIVGTPVTYYSVIAENGAKSYPLHTYITSEPWKMNSGEIVCKIEGRAGGVSIKHLEPNNHGKQ